MGYDVAFPVAAVVVQVQSFEDLVAAARSRVLRVRRVGVADVRELMQDCRFSKTPKQPDSRQTVPGNRPPVTFRLTAYPHPLTSQIRGNVQTDGWKTAIPGRSLPDPVRGTPDSRRSPSR